MFSKRIDPDCFQQQLDAISEWNEWDLVVRQWLELDRWPYRSPDDMECDLNRKDKRIAGLLWHACSSSYDIDPELEFLFEKSRVQIFAKLDPEGAASNEAHPELFGWRCVFCRIYTKHKTDRCGRCGREVVPLPLND